MKIIYNLGEKVKANNAEGTITDITTDNGNTVYMVHFFNKEEEGKFLAIEMEEI